jgi:ribonuclease VapC
VLSVSAGNYVEAALLLDVSRIDASRDPIASRRFDELMQEAQIVIEPVTGRRAEVAREVYRDFGKDSGHPARLNFKKTAKVSGRETKRQPAELNYTASQ